MQLARRIALTSFIVLNLLTMIRVFMPMNLAFFQTLYRPIDSYLSFFSIYQDWMMFAPNPNKLNSFLTATVEFEDGTTDQYEFPKGENLNILQKYAYGEKFRKLTTEGIRKDSNNFMWRDTARYVLRKLKAKHGYKIPVKVHLYRHWDEVPTLETSFRSIHNQERHYQNHNFYTYEVGE